MPHRILLVEDDFLERARLESALVHLGYEVVGAEDGDTALARLAAERFDGMLLDLVLPGLDGMGVLEALKVRGAAVPVVVSVTPAGLDAVASALRAGACDFVVKPAGALRLQVAITNALTLAALRAPGAAQTPSGSVGQPCPAAFAPARGRPLADDPAAGETLALTDSGGHARPLEQVEAEAIRAAVALYGGRMSEVARRLGIGRSTLYRKITALGLTVAEPYVPLAVAAE